MAAQHITKIVTHYSKPRLRTNPYAGFTQYARGYMTQGNNVPQGGNANYPAGGNPYQGFQDYARGYKASHPQEFQAPAGGPAPGQAQPGAAATPPPPPWDDPQYENTVAGINRRTGDTLANIEYQRGQTNQSYGYQTDPQGNLTVDPSNPFSKAVLLQRSYDQSQARTTNSAGNQLYAGSTQNALNAGTLGFQQNTDALKRAYQQAIEGLNQQRTSALTGQYIDTTTAQGEGLGRALANRPDVNTTAPEPQTGDTPWSGQPGFNKLNPLQQYLYAVYFKRQGGKNIRPPANWWAQVQRQGHP